MFSCELCSKEFKTRQNLNTHISRKFGCQSKTCPTCKKSFRTQINFRYHIDHQVCQKHGSNVDRASNQIKMEDFDLSKMTQENIKLLLEVKLKELSIKEQDNAVLLSKREQKHIINVISNNNNNNNNNTVVNLVSFGDENLEPLKKEVLNRISCGLEKGLTDYGIRELYFNPDCPENHIVKAPYPYSNKAEYFNGEHWCVSKKSEVAEKLLSGLVEAIKKRFKELPKDDQDLDRIYDITMNYVGDNIDDSTIFPKLVNLVGQQLIHHHRKLQQSKKASI